MTRERTPFLQGALEWLYEGAVPAVCGECGYAWDTTPGEAITLIETSPGRYRAAVEGMDGMTEPDDGSWNATAYVWHLADLARSWAERWHQVRAEPGSRLIGWDPDALAEVRGYRSLPTAPALWALQRAVEDLVAATADAGLDGLFLHSDWGHGDIADAMVWLGHEFHHHEGDVNQRILPITER